jgi:hypothetical protein
MIKENQFAPWPPEQVARLRELAGHHSAREISKILNRGYHGVSKQIRKQGLPRWIPPVKARPPKPPKAVAPKVEKKAPEPKPVPVAKPAPSPVRIKTYVEPSVPLRQKEPKRSVIKGEVEWCSVCGSPVSDWQGHFERLGHRKPAA